MDPEVHTPFVERQGAINKAAKADVEKSLKVLNLNMILSDRKKARQLFINAVVKRLDPHFNASLDNGHKLLKVKNGS